MQAEPKFEARQVVPRWRSIASTTSAELRSCRNNVETSKLANSAKDEYDDLKSAWKGNESLESASELVAAAIVFGPCNDADLAANFLLKNADTVSSVARLTRAYARGPLEANIVEEFEFQLAQKRIEIAKLKRKVANFPKNALLYSELARNYLILGERAKSEYHMKIALILRPTNRLLLRNFARLCVHLLKPEIGVRMLSIAPKGDVWIDAALMALSDLCDKPPVTRRYVSRDLIEIRRPPSEVTELLAAVGTHELRSGNKKIGRKLLKKCALGATDNTVAQLQWTSEYFGTTFDQKLLDVDKSFEARANAAAASAKWPYALIHGKKWAVDEPFSERPFIFGSYIAAEHLWNFDAAKNFALDGLNSNPNSPKLLNNLSYSEAMLGELESARTRIEQARGLVSSDFDWPAIQATSGLIAFRSGKPELGRAHYRESVAKAAALGRRSTVELALLHLLMEEFRLAGKISRAQFSVISRHFASDGKAADATKKVFESMNERIFESNLSDDGLELVGFPFDQLLK